MNPPKTISSENFRHKGWVKGSHWIMTLSFLALVFSGIMILMVHPRFYWGEIGNDLTPALFELPFSRNYKHGGWENSASFFNKTNSPISASRTYDTFNQNDWNRSLHFLAGWVLVLTGLVYLLAGLFTGHFRRHLWPGRKEFTLQMFWLDIRNHLRLQIPAPGSRYGLLQKCSYLSVIFFLFPLVILTGLTMSPAITAAYPILLKVFFGAQSARTIHFFASTTLLLFLLIHVAMVIQSGFKQQIRAMTLGK